MNEKIIAFLHILLITLVWMSPFLVRWEIIVYGYILYLLQLYLIGDCILTRAQFKTRSREKTFYSYLLDCVGVHLPIHYIRNLVDYVLPVLLIGTGFLLQKIYGFEPLFG